MAKVSRPVLYTALLGVLAYAVVVYTEPESKRPPAKPKRTTLASTTNAQFTKEDYDRRFDSYNAELKNAFKPGIVRLGGDSLLAQRLDGVPTALTGGDPNWRYTGTATIDGVRVALIENSATAEGVFLHEGESWKQAVLTKIDDEAIVMVGPGGGVRRIRLGEPDADPDPLPVTGGTGAVAPMRVGGNLAGQIGNSLEVVPETRNSERNGR
ncbi:MAG TPA: hypothetical protein PLL78_14530 [Fimbriimonadaceae bacterium]|nr:hypothetical protein [Fimbriimonadaceae bacterium]HRJ97891.1 hypothetical protein [Fimbriimonadaceae bacterium]